MTDCRVSQQGARKMRLRLVISGSGSQSGGQKLHHDLQPLFPPQPKRRDQRRQSWCQGMQLILASKWHSRSHLQEKFQGVQLPGHLGRYHCTLPWFLRRLLLRPRQPSKQRCLRSGQRELRILSHCRTACMQALQVGDRPLFFAS